MINLVQVGDDSPTNDQLGRSVLETHAAARARPFPDGTSPQAAYLDGRIGMMRARLHQLQNNGNPAQTAADRRRLIAEELIEQRRWIDLPSDQLQFALAVATGTASVLPPEAAAPDPTRALVTRLRAAGARLTLTEDALGLRVTGADHLSREDQRLLKRHCDEVVHLLLLEARGVLVLRPKAEAA